MNTQRIQNCTQATLICLLNEYTDALVAGFRSNLVKIQLKRERNQAYRKFQRLSSQELRDIGMDDPQTQYQTFGRYL